MCVCLSGFDWWHDTIPNFYFVNIVFAKNDKDYYYSGQILPINNQATEAVYFLLCIITWVNCPQ